MSISLLCPAYPSAKYRYHQWRIEGTPHSAMTWRVCEQCGAQEPRGPGLFYKPAAKGAS